LTVGNTHTVEAIRILETDQLRCKNRSVRVLRRMPRTTIRHIFALRLVQVTQHEIPVGTHPVGRSPTVAGVAPIVYASDIV
jgi:hypothetical protein